MTDDAISLKNNPGELRDWIVAVHPEIILKLSPCTRITAQSSPSRPINLRTAIFLEIRPR
jgi:hypothetical protein